MRIIHQLLQSEGHQRKNGERQIEGGTGGSCFFRFYAHFLGFCVGSAAGSAANSTLGFISSAMAAAAALMSCSELVVVGEEPDATATAAGAINICCSIFKLILLLLLASALRSFDFAIHSSLITISSQLIIISVFLIRFLSQRDRFGYDGGCYPLTTKFKQQLKTKTKKNNNHRELWRPRLRRRQQRR